APCQLRTANSSTRPAMTMPSANVRSCRSSSCASIATPRRQRCGAANGNSPSKIRKKAKPANKSAQAKASSLRDGVLRSKFRGGLFQRGAHAALQKLEEVAVGLQHEHVLLATDGGPVGLHAAVELVEVGVLTESQRVNFGGPSVAGAADALGIAIRLRK